ncbi:DDE-type integrase/transposase/recombinase [Streptomyces sp. ME02-6979.5a]|nr:Mu transposase C-terminal domain-containing protein [Streptomyces sp. ME02-6979.5a]MDX3343749.1 DDE-type integrase/transposase/recombinase [Streptomyces sp. ME02-6979.5a]
MADAEVLRPVAVRRLLALAERGELTAGHRRMVADTLGVSERTVRRWLAVARVDGRLERAERCRFTLTPLLARRLAFHRGSVAALHRELVAEAAAAGGGAVPSLATLYRAAARDVSPGLRAGMRGGEAARRDHDVFLQRPAGHRNEVWEADHVQVKVEVDIDGAPGRPWVTWFIDCATRVICGFAVTAQVPSRESVLVALRDAISREGEHGPFGGLPGAVRVDRGKDFLSRTVGEALGAFAVPVVDLPGYSPHLKGTVEALNKAAKQMFFASLPGYTAAPRLKGGRKPAAGQRLLPLEAFIELLGQWVAWWNTEHEPRSLAGRTPAAAWEEDLTPVEDAEPGALHMFTLEDDGRVRTLGNKGVRWRSRHYVDAWMTGQAGRKVRLRYMPHHEHEIEVYDATSGRHLGSAYLSNRASAEQIREMKRARAREADRLKRLLAAAEKDRATRYAAATRGTPAEVLGTVTELQAEAHLRAVAAADLTEVALPGYLPLPARLPASWTAPDTARPAASCPEDDDESTPAPR